MKNPKNKKQYIVAERTIYRSIGGLLKADLFKALTIGNTPRRCHNCGEYFFIIGLSDTKYCSRIAPNDPKGRFCNKVGAHIKEQNLSEKFKISETYQEQEKSLTMRQSDYWTNTKLT